MKNKLLRKSLSTALAISMLVTQFVGLVPVASAADEGETSGVFVEYFDQYDRRTDYSTDMPFYPEVGSLVLDFNTTSLYHAGIPDGIPATWSETQENISVYWEKGDNVDGGTDTPEITYNGEDLIGCNWFAMRFTSILTTPDFDGTYYFKVNVNDSKKLSIYTEDGSDTLGEFIHWDGTNSGGNVNTGSSTYGYYSTDTCTGFNLLDGRNDVISIELDANTSYLVVMETGEGKDTAFSRLHWLYGDDVTDTVATATFVNNAIDGTSDTDTIIPAEFFTLPEQYAAPFVQGYIYEDDGTTPAVGASMTAGDASAISDKNGYYCILNAESDTVSATLDSLVGAGVAVDGVVEPITMVFGDVEQYTITFDADGGSDVVEQTVYENQTATQPEIPQKAGFVFTGWYLDGATEAFDFATAITGHMTLTAGWRAEVQADITVVVTYDDGTAVDGATAILDDVSATTDVDGKAVFENITEGTYSLQVKMDDEILAVQEIVVTQDETINIEIESVVALHVASVETLRPLDVDYGTEESDLPLYDMVKTVLSDGNIIYPSVTWSCPEGYDPTTPGDYTFIGILGETGYYIPAEYTHAEGYKIAAKVVTANVDVPNLLGLTVSFTIQVREEDVKPIVWVVSDITKTETGAYTTDTDDISALGAFMLMSNEFDIRGISVGSTQRAATLTLSSQKDWVTGYYGPAYESDIVNLNAWGMDYDVDLMDKIIESSVRTTNFLFNASEDQSDLTGKESVAMMIDEVMSLEEGEIIYILGWGVVTEQATMVKYFIDTNQEEYLERVRFITHWTDSSLYGGNWSGTTEPSNFSYDTNSGWYLREMAYAGVVDYYEVSSIGQSGVVSGQPVGDTTYETGYYSQYLGSELGEIFVSGRYDTSRTTLEGSGPGPDHSDSATIWTLLGDYGVTLGNLDPRATNFRPVEVANQEAFYDSSVEIHEVLLSRAQLAATQVTVPQPEGTMALTATADVDNGTSTFTLSIDGAANVKAIYFDVDVSADAIVACEGFSTTMLTAGTYMLAYEQGNEALLSGDVDVAIITVNNAEGADITVSSIKVTSEDIQLDQEAISASTVQIFADAAALAIAKTAAQSELNGYKTAADYRDEQWTDVLNEMEAGNTAIEEADSIAAVEEALTAAKTAIDAIKTDAQLDAEELAKFDLNGDGSVGYTDITAIVPYWGFTVVTGEEDYAKYDVTGDGKINSADYLMVFSKIEVETAEIED